VIYITPNAIVIAADPALQTCGGFVSGAIVVLSRELRQLLPLALTAIVRAGRRGGRGALLSRRGRMGLRDGSLVSAAVFALPTSETTIADLSANLGARMLAGFEIFARFCCIAIKTVAMQ
jgi:hypothetical protein